MEENKALTPFQQLVNVSAARLVGDTDPERLPASETVPVTFRISKDLSATLDTVASLLGLSKSEVLREIIDWPLNDAYDVLTKAFEGRVSTNE